MEQPWTDETQVSETKVTEPAPVTVPTPVTEPEVAQATRAPLRLEMVEPAPVRRSGGAVVWMLAMVIVLLIASVLLVRESVPADPGELGAWLATRSSDVALAMYLVPFSGIAFLWFIGVLRDRLGAHEDQLFTTVFLGSGLLFLTMLFFAGAMAGGIVLAHAAEPERFAGSQTFRFARTIVHEIVNVYGSTIKELIHEEFGDGIMSAIDFKMDITREADPKGDRVNVVLSGKFLPYKTY